MPDYLLLYKTLSRYNHHVSDMGSDISMNCPVPEDFPETFNDLNDAFLQWTVPWVETFYHHDYKV